jgi:3-oxoadipate enol-lactonase
MPVVCAVGGAVALAVASRHPERCPAVVALAPATVIPEARQAAVRERTETLSAEGIRPGLQASLDRSYPPVLRDDAGHFDKVRAMRLGADPIGVAGMFRMLASLDMRAELGAIRCPALVLAGRHDGDRPPEHVESITAAIPGATFKTIHSGHFMALHAPSVVRDEISAFLAEVR